SMDDEYFRLSLTVREEHSEHEAVKKIQPAVLRSLSNPKKAGMLGSFLKNLRVMEHVTPGGIIIKTQLGIEQNMVRLRGVVQRTVKGLFYHHKQFRLPERNDVLVFNEESLQEWPADHLGLYKKNVIAPLLAQNPVTFGNGVFSYRFGYNTADPNTTY